MARYSLRAALAATTLLLTFLPSGAREEQELHMAKEKISRLHFYLHDRATGKDPTAVLVATAPSTNKSSTFFGAVLVIDDLLTEGPEPSSKAVGRMQGLYSAAGLDDIHLVMSTTIVLRGGEFDGSTLSMVGNNMARHKLREMPIVGGSGKFRLARGYAVAKTYSINPPDAVVEYQVTVFHY